MEMILQADIQDMKSEQEKAQLHDDQQAAKQVLPLLHDHHRLLVTLALSSIVAREGRSVDYCPLVMDNLLQAWTIAS